MKLFTTAAVVLDTIETTVTEASNGLGTGMKSMNLGLQLIQKELLKEIGDTSEEDITNMKKGVEISTMMSEL